MRVVVPAEVGWPFAACASRAVHRPDERLIDRGKEQDLNSVDVVGRLTHDPE